jgi:hypothetical protein
MSVTGLITNPELGDGQHAELWSADEIASPTFAADLAARVRVAVEEHGYARLSMSLPADPAEPIDSCPHWSTEPPPAGEWWFKCGSLFPSVAARHVAISKDGLPDVEFTHGWIGWPYLRDNGGAWWTDPVNRPPAETSETYLDSLRDPEP